MSNGDIFTKLALLALVIMIFLAVYYGAAAIKGSEYCSGLGFTDSAMTIVGLPGTTRSGVLRYCKITVGGTEYSILLEEAQAWMDTWRTQ